MIIKTTHHGFNERPLNLIKGFRKVKFEDRVLTISKSTKSYRMEGFKSKYCIFENLMTLDKGRLGVGYGDGHGGLEAVS